MESLEKFLPVAFVIWGTFAPGSAIVKELNEIRNKILDDKSSFSIEHKKLFYFNDWRGMFWSSVFYQVFVFILVYLLAWKFIHIPEDIVLGLICAAFALMSIVRLVVHVKAFWFADRPAIESCLGIKS